MIKEKNKIHINFGKKHETKEQDSYMRSLQSAIPYLNL